MKRALEDVWRDVDPYLDEVLTLDPEAQATWLHNLQTQEPVIAAEVASLLGELAELQRQHFLDSGPVSALSGATLAGQRFGSYTLDRPIGHGGTGTVWLAHRSDGRFEGEAAVKLLNPSLVGHPSERRFVREGSVLARLRHPNIARLMDAGVAAGSQPYLILEYVEGEPIDRYCERFVPDIERRIVLFLDVLAAVAHAHSNLIVHRDLKPSNILVAEGGVVKLLDFGVASLLSSGEDDSTQLTHHAVPGLTPGYASPEQLLGEAITTASDVYALGVVLFVLLAGRHPVASEGKTAVEMARLTLDTETPRLSETVTETRHQRVLRGDLDNIIAMALRRNPADRYTTVELFSQDLRRYLALEPVAARPRSLRYLAGKFVRRHRRAVAAATAATMVLIGAVIVITVQMLDARRQHNEVRYQARRAEATADFMGLLLLSNLDASRPALTYLERLDLGVDLINKQYRDDPKFAGRMLIELAAYYRDDQQTLRANELYAQAYAIGQRTHDVELMASAQCDRAYGEARADIKSGVVERLDDARHLLEQLSRPDATLQTRCLMAQAHVEQLRGESSSAEAMLRKAMSILEVADSTHRQVYVEVLGDLGGIYLARNQLPEMLRITQLMGEIHDRNGRGGTDGRLIARQNAAVALSAMGEVSAALAEREIINRHLHEVESPGQEPPAFAINYATLLLRMARPAAALQALDGALDRARAAGNPAILTQTLLTTGSTFIQLGRWSEADAALQEAGSLAADGIGNRAVRAQIESFKARLALARGDLESAHKHKDAALEFAGYRTQKPERPLGKVLLIAAQVALAEGSAADAEQYAKDALAIGETVARGPDTSADVGESLLRLAQARISSGTRTGTRPLLQRAVQCLTNGLEANHPFTLEARSLLAGSQRA